MSSISNPDREQLIRISIEGIWHNRLAGERDNFNRLYQSRNLVTGTGQILGELDILEHHKHFLVWGIIGSGKTYLLHSLARSVLVNNLWFPLWLDLRQISSPILEELYCQNALDPKDISYLIQAGKAIVLIDNFEESHIPRVEQFCYSYGQNTIVIATRANLQPNDLFLPRLRLNLFHETQIYTVLSANFGHKGILTSELFHNLNEIKTLLSIPLFLDILCNSPVYFDDGKLVQLWLDLVSQKLGFQRELIALQKLATLLIIEQRSKLSRPIIENICCQEQVDPIGLIHGATIAGILGTYQDSYQFLGNGITNYLAAQGIVYMTDSYRQWDYQRQGVGLPKYHSLIKFLCDFLIDSQPFILLLKHNLENLITANSPEAVVFDWIEQQLSTTQLEYSKEVIQSLYLGFLLATQFSMDIILLPSQSLPILLEPSLAVPLSLVVVPNIALDMAINQSLYRALEEPLQFSHQTIRAQEQIQRHDPEEFMYWWDSKGQKITDTIKIMQDQCRKYVRILSLESKQWQHLRNYYHANFLVTMCQQLNYTDRVDEISELDPKILEDKYNYNQEQIETLKIEIQALRVKIDFLLLERSKISTNLDQMSKIWHKLQPKMVLLDRLLNSQVWKKLEQQIKLYSKN